VSITRIPLLIAIVVALGGTAVAQPAPPSPEDLEKAKAAYLEGRRLIDEDKNIEAGVAKFKESYRLSRNPLLLYNIGVAFDQLKQKTLALFYYKKFLSDAPEGAPNRDLATERVAVLEKEAVGEDVSLGTASTSAGKETDTGKDRPPSPFDDDAPVKKTPPPAKKTPPPAKKTPPPAKKAVTEFQHNVVEEAPPGRPLDLTAFIPEGANWQVSLNYRPAGQIDFKTVAMKERYSELVGRIPADVMKGSSIQYYLEARDMQGKVVARSGRSTSPNLVLIDDSARPRFYPDLDGGGSAAAAGGGGANLGGGGGPTGPTDTQRDIDYYLTWGSTATAGGALTLAVTFYFIAADASSGLEGEAFNSTNEGCAMGPPCRAFGDDQEGLESRGKTFETLTNVMLVTGVVAAGAAGYFWYKDLKRDKRAKRSGNGTDVAIVPLLSDELVGGAAAVRF
jgi:hypothetical protein